MATDYSARMNVAPATPDGGIPGYLDVDHISTYRGSTSVTLRHVVADPSSRTWFLSIRPRDELPEKRNVKKNDALLKSQEGVVYRGVLSPGSQK